jgi:two-component sensor histidine kinase/ActR/RegA family two-component response regulator
MPKVMIAEDDLLMADILEDVLIHYGYEVCGIARTVKEGVEIGEHCKPDLAVLDMRLAKGGLGTEIAAQLRRQNGLGILYAMGNADHASLTKADGEACLSKPYRPEDVAQALKIVEQIVRTGEASKPFPKGFHVLGGAPSSDRAADFGIAEARSQITRLRRQQAELATFGGFALREHDLGKVLTEAVRVCAGCLDVPFCKISRYRHEENDLLVEAGVGWTQEVIGCGSARADETTPQGRAFVTGVPVICGNLAEDSSFLLPSFYAEHGIISTFNVIISRGDEPYGVLGIDSPVRHEYDEHDIAFLTGFANVVAEAVGTSKRTADMLRAVDRMRDLVADGDRLLAAKNVLLDEKHVLGEELQHRVRNNLQLVYGMLDRQLQITTDVAGRDGLGAIGRRVLTLAKVYDHLLGAGLSRTIDFGNYLSSLCENFQALETVAHPKVVLTCQCEPVVLDLDTVSALGLVVAELIANSFHHAFPEGTGAIAVSLLRGTQDEDATLVFSDDSTGFIDAGASKLHGLGLVRRLMEQVEGSVALRSDHGTEWTLKFPVPVFPSVATSVPRTLPIPVPSAS